MVIEHGRKNINGEEERKAIKDFTVSLQKPLKDCKYIDKVGANVKRNLLEIVYSILASKLL